jgi:hypothetical protein
MIKKGDYFITRHKDHKLFFVVRVVEVVNSHVIYSWVSPPNKKEYFMNTKPFMEEVFTPITLEEVILMRLEGKDRE